MNKVRTITIDGVEIQTSLSALEIADLHQKNQELQKENEKNKHYKTLYQSLKKQKEELRSLLEEKIICYENPQNTNLGEYERKIHFDLYNDVLGKMEELEGVNNE